jgi:nicotinamide-nucleotide amidase
MEERIGEIISGFARRMRFDPEALRAAKRKQAMVPTGATALDPIGTAPGLVVPAGDQVVIVLPGPPRELQAMWTTAIETEPVRGVLARTEPFRTTSIRMFGIPESELAQALGEISDEADLDPLEITTCLRGGELVTDVRYRAGDEEAMEGLVRGLDERLGRFTYSVEGEPIELIVGRLMGGRTLAVAESCTGGMLAARLTDGPGASLWFAGGAVTYSDESKAELLGVDPKLIEAHGAVSPEVAEAMADGALARFEADVACSVTGVAGPTGGTESKPVGYVCFCAKLATGEKLARDPVLPGAARADIRERSVVVALHLIRFLLEGREPPR